LNLVEEGEAMSPRFEYCRDTSKLFVNPYNFVPVEYNRISRENGISATEEELLTGRLKCRMLCKTPIAIPDTDPERIIIEEFTKKGEKIKHPHYSFMKIDGVPIIPGSSIRGVLRSVYETATDSCFSTLNPDTRLTMRNNNAKDIRAGILKRNQDGNWILYQSKRYMLKARSYPKSKNNGRNEEAWDKTRCPVYEVKKDGEGKYICSDGGKRCHSGDKVFFSVLMNGRSEVQYKSKKNIDCGPVAAHVSVDKKKGADKEGYLMLGEFISNKHHESVFADINIPVNMKEFANPAKAVETAMEGLEDTLKVYRNSSVNKGYQKTHDGYPMYQKMKAAGVIPVWYLCKGRRLYLSYAALGRIAFEKFVNKHVGKMAPCTSRNALCPACKLFGMVSKDQTKDAYGSRIRVTDAKAVSGIDLEEYTLAELSSPRPSYIPFYATVGANQYKGGANPGYDDNGVTIRGRKYYWHSDNFEQINHNIEKTDRNATMEVMESGAVFEFSIYFDRITKTELQKLVWSINFWENDIDGKYMHKIGHGKPIGLGSAKIVVDYIRIRNFECSAGYSDEEEFEVKYSEDAPVNEDSKTVRSLKRISDYEQRKDVCYPFVGQGNGKIKGEEAYHWFAENKTIRKGDDPKRKIQFLPPILGEQRQEMEAMRLISRN